MNLFFDLDGTLADPIQAIASSFHHACDTLQLERPTLDTIKACIGPPLYETFPTILGDQAHRLHEAIAAFRAHHGETGIYQYEFYDGMDETLTKLKHHHPIYVVTSKPTAYAKPIMDHFGRSHYFEEIYGSELDGTRADKAHLIAHILEKEKMPPFDAVMIGDRKHDIIAAKKNGVRSIGVLWGYGSRGELEQAGADEIVESWEELVSRFL